jgi:hypothetical protein
MRTRQRRARSLDPLATTAGVRGVCEQLRRRLPAVIPSADKELFSLLNAVRHLGRYRANETRKGRPPRWDRDTLLEVSRHLSAVLERETNARVSVSSFVGLYLRVLHFPADVVSALERGEINLQEATLLARLSHGRLGTDSNAARALRRRVLKSHLETGGSQNRLRMQVQEVLGESALISSDTLSLGLRKADALLEVDPEDARHLFFETMKDLFYAIRRFDAEELEEADIDEIMSLADSLSSTIHAIWQRVRARKEPKKQFGGFAREAERGQSPAIETDAEGRIIYRFK